MKGYLRVVHFHKNVPYIIGETVEPMERSKSRLKRRKGYTVR